MGNKVQDTRRYVTDKKNRTTIAAVGGVIAIVSGIITFIAKRGKAKR